MLPYNYGFHYDMEVGGRATASTAKKAFETGVNSYAVEFHVDMRGYDTTAPAYLLQKLASNSSGAIQLDMVVSGGVRMDDQTITLPPIKGDFLRLRFERDTVASTVTAYADMGDGVVQTLDTSAYTGGFPNELAFFGWQDRGPKLALTLMQRDTGSGWTDYSRVEPGLVPANAGGYVPRGDADAVAGSENRIYDTTDGTYFDISYVDQPNTFPVIYNVTDVNGGTIAIGDTAFTVTMSSAITVDDMYFTDGTNSYHPVVSVDGTTITGSVPLTSDDTMPNFGTLTMNVVSGPDTFSKDFEFTAPAGHTVRLLVDPIELDESSYSNGQDPAFTPIAGDNYFWLTNTDFDITENNVVQPSGTPPWQHTVWHLSGSGLRETEIQSGYGTASSNQAPTANAGPDQANVAAGATVTLDGSLSSDDGTITGYSWTQTAGDTVTLSDATAVSPTFTAPTTNAAQRLTFELVVTDNESVPSSPATVNIDVLAEATVSSNLTVSITNIADGTYDTRVIDADTGTLLVFGSRTWTSGSASFTLTDIPVGTNCEVYVLDPDEAGVQRGITV